MIRAPVYELRPGSALANWLAFVLLGRPTAVITVDKRAYEIYRLTPQLAKGNINLHPRKQMTKPSTQILALIVARTSPDGTATLSVADCAEIKRLTRVIDRRDQQARKAAKKHTPVKHTPTKKKTARR